MPIHHRVIHLFMGVCYLIAAVCTAQVANQSSGQASVLLWLFNVPVILVVAHAVRLAFGRATQE